MLKKAKIFNLGIKLVASLLMLSSVFASQLPIDHVVVDIYGTHKLSNDFLVKKYQYEFAKIFEIMRSPLGINSEINNQIFVNSIMKMKKEIISMGRFASVNISPILYPGDNIIYFTIDIVEQKDIFRLLYFNKPPTKTIIDPDHLIKKWMEYEKLGFSLVYRDKKFPEYSSCPAHHCLFGFEQPELQKFKTIFDSVEKNKLALVDILRHDKNENKRASAAFLLAHIKSAEELVDILIPSINDPNEKVRNNAMRVIGFTLMKSSDLNIPIEKITRALNFPNSTDRNKAMLIILSLVNNKKYANYVLRHCSSELIDELKLQQPNNHFLSYEILKKISGKSYSDRDYLSWNKWLI